MATEVEAVSEVLQCADVLLRNGSLTHSFRSLTLCKGISQPSWLVIMAILIFI